MKSTFRIYDNSYIAKTYKKLRSKQTVEHVLKMRQKHATHHNRMSIWEVFEELNNLIDSSDPDITIPNIHHLIQTAEGLRKDGYSEELQLTGLLHDAGKILYKWGSDEDGTSADEQWGLVGDTFVVGCRIPDTVIYPEFNSLNPDMHNPNYNTPLGMYTPGCGLDNVLVSYGHDEYLYNVLEDPKNKNSLGEECKYLIRFHSLYPWHQAGEYSLLESNKDLLMKKYVQCFNEYDLYTKENVSLKIEDYKEYYSNIYNQFFATEYLYF